MKSVKQIFNQARYEVTMTTFNEIISLKQELDRKLQEFGKDAFETAFQPFFDLNPTIDAIAWLQYTPYFNDGDACTFGVREPALVSKDLCDLYGIGDNYPVEFSIASWDCRQIPELQAMFEEFDKIWDQIDESIFLAVFGDHVRVTINRDGTIKVEDYDHD